MTKQVKDRVCETSTTTGTGAYALAGALDATYQTFPASGVANGDTFKYCAVDPVNGGFEVGVGTWNTGGTLARTEIEVSSNANAAVNWPAGTRTIFMTVTAADYSSAMGTAGKQAIYIAAGAMRPSFTGGCANLGAIASAANQPDIVTLNFDASTQEFAQFHMVMPKKWDEGAISFKPHWSHAATTTNFGVVWQLQAVAVGDDDAIAAAFGSAQTSTDTGGTTNDLYTGPESSAITVSGSPGAEDMVFFRVARVPADAGDTMAIDARLHGITLFVTTDAGTDA